MKHLLLLSRAIDSVNTFIGRWASWLVLVAILVSAANAVSRKFFSLSSNAWLELQWYLFGAVFMLGASWTLLRNEHVRIDIVTSSLSKRSRDLIDVFGHVFFLIPFALLSIYMAIPFFLASLNSWERSNNTGGLVIWPAKFIILAGFVLVLAQGISELIKRIAILRGDIAGEQS